jgi:hypothetical protein
MHYFHFVTIILLEAVVFMELPACEYIYRITQWSVDAQGAHSSHEIYTPSCAVWTGDSSLIT